MKEMGKIGNDVKAKFYFERASDNQDSYAQLQLAKFYKQRGNQDLEMYYLKRSSDLGRIEAIHDLALVYLEGNKFCKKDFEAAIRYLEKGVELGHSKSMVTLAVLLQDEKSVLNIPKSIQLLERAVNLQDSEAYYRLALAYKDGLEGVERNFKRSFELLEKSSSLQNCNSMSVLGDIYWCGYSSGGFNVQKDVNLGKQYYKQSAKRMNDASLVKLSAFYENGRENFKKNVDKSADCLFSSYNHNKNDTSKSKFLHLLRSKQISWRSKFHSLWELDSSTEYVILLLLLISKHSNNSLVPFGKGVFMNIIKFVCHINQVSKFDRFFFYKTKFFY